MVTHTFTHDILKFPIIKTMTLIKQCCYYEREMTIRRLSNDTCWVSLLTFFSNNFTILKVTVNTFKLQNSVDVVFFSFN